LYHQLAEIHAITAVQLAECARWHRSDPTSSPVGKGPLRCPSQQGWHRRHHVISHPGPCGGNGVIMSNPKLTDRLAKGTQACDPNAAHGTRAKVNVVTFLGTPLRRCTTLPSSMPLAMRWPNFALSQAAGRRPQVAERRHHLMLPSTAPRRAPRAARRGTSNVLREA
jgi:hypothetical protein